jgi:tight adherence protein B
MMDTPLLLFSVLVFVAALLAIEAVITSLYGSEAQRRKRLRSRLQRVKESGEERSVASLLREQYSREPTALAGLIEGLPGMSGLARLITQAGRSTPVHVVMLVAGGAGLGGALLAWMVTGRLWVAAAAGIGAGLLPVLKIRSERSKRLARVEEQLPEALDIIVRSLKAGHPFNDSLLLVAEELSGPMAEEFGHLFAELNYGTEVKTAFANLLERTPSATLKVLVTSVLVQRETGGNLAEILGNIASVVRGRFRFQRKVRTLSAEGRLSGWVLVAVPFALFGLLSLTSPEYAADLVQTETGNKMVGAALVLILIGGLWIRRLVRIEV